MNNAARGMRFVNERFMTDPKPFWEADPAAWRMVIETHLAVTDRSGQRIVATEWNDPA